MELKPSRDKAGLRPRLDGMGRRVAKGDEKNPFAQLARGMDAPTRNQRKRPFADTLGATPPRDGPFSMGAADIAVQKPPKGRLKRKKNAGTTWLR